MDDAYRLRDRAAQADYDDRLGDEPPGGGAPVLVARSKVISSYPNVAAAYYGMESQTITGTEAEGGPATITTDGDTFYAYNLGATVPPQGTPVICTFMGSRWCFRYD